MDLYDYRPIVDREPVAWPGGARLAVYVGLNIEHFHPGHPSTSIWEGTASLDPDPLNHGWRDYGARVGVWRLMETLDRHGIRATALINSDAAERYPQIVSAGRARDWAWVAHGRSNSFLHNGLGEDEERAELRHIVDTIERTTGQRPRGWLGPGLSETPATPRLLAELGLQYVLDWTMDDQPVALNVPGLYSVPYSVELNDLGLRGLSGPDFAGTIVDQFDRLHAEGGRVMALALHPFVAGQAHRARHLDAALAHIAGHDGVWLATSDEIAAHYARAVAR